MDARTIDQTPLSAGVGTRDPSLGRRAERIERFANRLDRSFSVPGTRFRVGYDGLIGLVPGIGDTIGFGLSAWLIGEAAQAGCRKRVLAKMLGNAAVDSVLGAVPLVGDLFDLGFKANVRNARFAANELRRIEKEGR
jgi:hypothetical protein